MLQITRNAVTFLLVLLLIGSIAGTWLNGRTVSAAFMQERRSNDPFSRTRPPSRAEVNMEKAQQKARKKEQYESLKKDTDQLLALAMELKANVDKTTEDTLSLDVIKKTEEVEKLAKKVREEMKNY